jgi:hypothetical protein
VAAGSDPNGNGASGQFTTPNLGDTSRAVTVEAQVTQSEEETALRDTLQYLAASGGPTAPGASQPDTATAPQPGTGSPGAHSAPAPQLTPAQSPPPAQRAPRSQRVRRRTRGKRHARPRAQGPTHRNAKQRAGERPRSRRRGERRGSRRTHVAAGTSRAGASSGRAAGDAKPTSTKQSKGSPAERSPGGPGPRPTGLPTTLLTVPPSAPAIFSLTGGLSGGDDSSASVTAILIFALLAFVAVVLARGRARGWRPAYIAGPGDEAEDEEILRGAVHVPRMAATSSLVRHLARLPAARSTHRRRPALANVAEGEDEDEILKGAVHEPAPQKGSGDPRP